MTLAKKPLLSSDKDSENGRDSSDKDSENGRDSNSSFSPDSGMASNASVSPDLNEIKSTESIEPDNNNMNLNDQALNEDSLNADKSLIRNFTFNDKKIDEFIKEKISNAMLVENIGTEMTYSISNKTEHTKNYENFFHDIEKNMESLGKFRLLNN